MINLSLESLQENLSNKGFAVELQKETKQLYIIYKINDKEFPLFLRIFGEGELLQLIAFIPCEVKTSARGDIGRLLHRLNKELDIPGFGMDEQADLLFYRLMMPSIEKKIVEGHLHRYVASIEEILKNFSPVIAYVASGTGSYDDVQKKLHSIKQ